MAFNQILWTADLAATLYETSDWYKIGRDWSSYVNGVTVNLPQGGSATVPVLEGALVPFTAGAATFGTKTFNNTGIFAPARTVGVANDDEASFDTRTAVMEQIVSELKQAVSQQVAYAWAPLHSSVGSIVRSTGVATRLNQYGNTVKKITFSDLLQAKAKFLKNTIGANQNDLYIIVDPFQYIDLVDMGSAFQGVSTLTESSTVDGFVGTIAGLKVIQRSLGIPYTAAMAAKAAVDYTNAYDNTHLSAALIVEGSKVGVALGTPSNGQIALQIMENAANVFKPIMQAYTRIGAATLYDVVANTIPGVMAIVEAV